MQRLCPAEEGTRTLDLRITNATRYQLRHFGLLLHSIKHNTPLSQTILDYYIRFSMIFQSLFFIFLLFFENVLVFFQKT